MKGSELNRRHFILPAVAASLLGLCALVPSYAQSAPKASKPVDAEQTILVVGDSLSAEYGLQRGTGWVALMEKKIRDQKINARVINASISGDTTSGGRARLPALLAQYKPTHVVLELGGNDALRGLPLQNSEDNLASMASTAKKTGAKVLIVGIQVPPNYGTDYFNKFAGIFEKVAKAENVAVVPFLLRGVADVADVDSMFQSDRIHPLAKAHPTMLNNVWPEMRKLLK